MRSCLMIYLLAGTLTGCATTPTTRETPATQPGVATSATRAAEQPGEVERIISGMSSDSYAARQAAMDDMRQLIVRRAQETAQLQESLQSLQLSLVRQLESLTLSSDPEAQARIAGLFEFQFGLTAWLLEANTMPEKERRAMTEWGLLPGNVRLVAGAYARKPQERIAALKSLVKQSGPQVDWLLSQLMTDEDLEVTMATLDAVWERPLTEPMLDVLWNRAVVSSTQQFRPRNNVRTFTVRGRPVQIYEQAQPRSQEIDLIVDLLVQGRDPRVGDRLNAFFDEMMTTLREPNDYRWRMISSNFGDSGRVLMRLTEAYKPAKAMAFLMRSISNNSPDGYSTTVNNVQYRSSSRVEACAILLRMNNQNPEDFGIVKHPNMGNRYLLKGAEKEEEELIKKVQTWWKEQGKPVEAEK